MSGLAKVARILGAEVTGSDRATTGHAASNVPEGATVVYSSAIAPDNPERTTGAPELHRADLLGELTQLKPTIAVSGTHGKTTTTSMIVHALDRPELPGRGRRPLAPAPTPTGPTASGSSSRPTSPTAACSSCTRRSRSSPTPSSTTTPPTPRRATLTRPSQPSSRSRSTRSCRPTCCGSRPDATTFGEYEGDAAGAGRAQPAQRRGGARRRSSSPGVRARQRSPTSRAPAAASRTSATLPRRPDRRRLRPPPDRGPRHDRGARSRARSGSSPSSSRTSSAARSARPQRFGQALAAGRPRRSSSTSIPRARNRATTPASPACWSPRPPPTPRHGKRVVLGARPTRPPRAFLRERAPRRRPPADDGRRRREHDRQGPRRARRSTHPMIRRLKVGLVAVAVIALTAGGAVWLRDSSLVAVTDVEITGRHRLRRRAGQRQALTAAAQDMTTLHVREDVLRDAVARYTSVGDITIQTDFPHTLTIRVIERRPVAALARPAADARPGHRQRHHPARRHRRPRPPERLSRHASPAGRADHRQEDPQRPRGRRARRRNRCAAGPTSSPSTTAASSQRSITDPNWCSATASRREQKWAAAARVLAEISAQGATYLDLRIPGRVAAGGLAPVADADPRPEPST